MKRFTDTEMPLRPWYRALEPRLKCLWVFMLCRCDMAGVLDMDWPLASFSIGAEVGPCDLKAMNGNIVALPSGKLFIPGFIPFQYGELRESRVHEAVLRVLASHSIPYPYPMDTHSGVADTPKDKDKDKETDKDKDQKKGVKGEGTRFTPPTPAEVSAYSAEIKYPMDGAAWCDSYAQKGWMCGKAKMKDWKAAVRNWKRNGWQPGRVTPAAPSKPKWQRELDAETAREAAQ